MADTEGSKSQLDNFRGAAFDLFIQALSTIAGSRLVDRRVAARQVVEALYRLLVTLREHDAIGPVSDLRDAFADLHAGRRAELFEPRRKTGRRTSVREHRMKAWAIAAAEELESRGFDAQQANRNVGNVVNVYGFPLGRIDSSSVGSVIAGWRRNIGRANRTPKTVVAVLPHARRTFHRCTNIDEVLSFLAHYGFEEVQYAPVLGKRAERFSASEATGS